MSKKIDLTNKRVGKLLVLQRVSGKNNLWKCLCDCGKKIIVKHRALVTHTRKSCGCLRIKNMKNKRFGRLTVIGPYKWENRGSYGFTKWKCKCDCGKHRWFKSATLTSGGAKSCGCLWKHEAGDAAKKTCFSAYRIRSKKRNLSFNLSFDQFINITQELCHYCGASPSNVLKHTNGNYIYSGIDRVDNNKGYLFENCVPCCGKCNTAKRQQQVEEFLELVKNIYIKHNLQDFRNEQ